MIPDFSKTTSARLFSLLPWSLITLAVGVMLAGAYLPTLNFPFVSDDGMYLAGNPEFLSLPAAEWWRLFLEPFNGPREFLPLRELSLWLDYRWFGLVPAAFRAHNIALYLLSLPLVFVLSAEVWRHFAPAQAADARWVAVAVTVLFAVNPVLVESVVWISGRKYLLPNLLSLIALWCAFRSLRDGGLGGAYAAAASVAFAGVMLAKTSYVTVGLLIMLIWAGHWLALPRIGRRRRELFWLAAIAAVAIGLLQLFLTMGRGDVPADPGLDRIGPAGSLAMLAWLLRLGLGVEARHLYYPALESEQWNEMVLAGVLVLSLVGFASWTLWRRKSLIALATLAFFVLCLPYLHLMPFGSPSAVQDRYLSLAIWPLILGIVALAWRLQRPLRLAVLSALALWWGGQTLVRAPDWHSFESLVAKDAKAFPGYFVPAYFQLAAVELPHGRYRDAMATASAVTQPETRRMMQDLVRAAHAANVDAVNSGNPAAAMASLWALGEQIQRRPAPARWHGPLALVWGDGRNILKQTWTDLVRHFPADPVLRYNFSLWLLREGWLVDAARHLRVVVDSPRLPPNLRGVAYRNLGLATLHQGQVRAAETAFLAALAQLPPDRRAACGLAEVYRIVGTPEQRQSAESACAQAPGRP
jgi:hypothetical protein